MRTGYAKVVADRGDITTQDVDAVVNAANRRMRGGGGVGVAIHAAGGHEVLADCVSRFPHGLVTGDAGRTTAGKMPARWVIHTVGPNDGRGETDRDLLTSCYRRCLEVDDELGAETIAFPLISAGVYARPLEDATDAADAADTTLRETPTDVRYIRLVAYGEATHQAWVARLEHERRRCLGGHGPHLTDPRADVLGNVARRGLHLRKGYPWTDGGASRTVKKSTAWAAPHHRHTGLLQSRSRARASSGRAVEDPQTDVAWDVISTLVGDV